MLRKIPIRQSLQRDNLFYGCERPLIMVSGLCCSILIFMSFSLSFILVGLGLWGAILFLLRKAGKYDPQLSIVYFRFLKYRYFYPPYSKPYRRK